MTTNSKESKELFTEKPGIHKESLEETFLEHLEYTLVKDKQSVTKRDTFKALAYTVRDRLVHNYLRTKHEHEKQDVKKVYYLSMEFLIGRLLANTLMNLTEYKESKKILKQVGYDLESIRELEPDMGLGNGGLGRLAAGFMDSLATLEIPATGYTIRYENGIFKQLIRDGYQKEEADDWLEDGNPWEIKRAEYTYNINFYGELEEYKDDDGNKQYKWKDTDVVNAIAHDVLIPGYECNTVNSLRLWEARSAKGFDFHFFNSGDYVKAVLDQNNAENISKVLYPNDSYPKGKFLRLKQEYFLVSASIQDIIRKFKNEGGDIKDFHKKTAIQLNDTHPALAIPELMRILVDDEKLDWETAWNITQNTFAYTNHTILPEALEKWSLKIMQKLLPRHTQIIMDINQRFLNQVKKQFPKDTGMMRKMSIFEEGPEKQVRMANLSIIGSHSVNGVAKLHTSIITNTLFKEFYKMYPDKFNNKTNGITPRRWIKESNLELYNLLQSKIGKDFIKDLDKIQKIEKYLDDSDFRKKWHNVKLCKKSELKKLVKEKNGIEIDENSLFDVHVKRFHEYKRQLLNIMHVITKYNRIKQNPKGDYTPRTVIFSGKAAPGYYVAKLIIKLINSVAETVNNDPEVNDKLKVVFLENYSVSLAEVIIPATDLSQQISTAGYEASGTGCMKLALNGALTLGTMDGANIEMADHIGKENMFTFGLSNDEVVQLKEDGYNPRAYYKNDSELKKVLDMIRDGYFNPESPNLFEPIFDSLVDQGDNFMLLADFDDYIKTQEKVDKLYKKQDEWIKKSILNSARIGFFSSDRTVKQYADEIWGVKPVKIEA